MKIERVEFRNFKLLDGVVLDFSTDLEKPLTVVRAENGNGKTSLAVGLAWAFYGEDGLAEKNLRLSSKASPIGVPTEVQVVVNFEHDPDGQGDVQKYVLKRSVKETPTENGDAQHGAMKTELFICRQAGEESVPGSATAVMERFMPLRLKDVFLTDGQKVESFISGAITDKERQHNVHVAIKALLGLDRLQSIEKDALAVLKSLRKDAADSGGDDLIAALNDLMACENALDAANQERDSAVETRARIEQDISSLENKLQAIQGHGDLDSINAGIRAAKSDVDSARREQVALLEDIRSMFKSDESLSWAFAEKSLAEGHQMLSGPAVKGIIPGSAVGVLRDRLDLDKCICGESLAEGTKHREQVLRLLHDQAGVSAEVDRLTETFHRARAGLDRYEGARADGVDFWSKRPIFVDRHIELADRHKDAQHRVHRLELTRAKIDMNDVRELGTSLATAKIKLTEISEAIGSLDHRITQLTERKAECKRRHDAAQRAAKADVRIKNRVAIATDFHAVISKTLAVIKNDHVAAVSDRMNDKFMEIIGVDSNERGVVIHGVHLSEKFDIVPTDRDGKSLSVVHELAGAQQRALTLAFIWALVEVSGAVAPQIIDTPLGIVSGALKKRMAEAITRPVQSGRPDYQTVLLLTLAEIDGIEGILDERAGRCQTLTCSADAADLVHRWDVQAPTIRHCACTHRQFCDQCERHIGADLGLVRRV